MKVILLDIDKSHSENGLTVAKVYVEEHGISAYPTYAVVQEVKNTSDNAEYVLLNSFTQCVGLPRLLRGITQVGTHFIIDELTGDRDGNHFFVTDCVRATKDESVTDHLLFDIDCNDKRISNAYSRNDEGDTDDEIDVPYEDVKNNAIKKLDDKLSRAEIHKRSLIQKKFKEQ